MLHFTDRKEHLSLDTSDFNKSKRNDPVEILRNIYKNTTMYPAPDSSSKLIGGFLDMFTWQAWFIIINELLVNTQVSTTLLICYFSDNLALFRHKGEDDEVADTIIVNLIKNMIKRLFNASSDDAKVLFSQRKALIESIESTWIYSLIESTSMDNWNEGCQKP